MNYERPDRYEPVAEGSVESGVTATMESHPSGDYVTHDDYCSLLDAYNEAIDKLSQISDIAR